MVFIFSTSWCLKTGIFTAQLLLRFDTVSAASSIFSKASSQTFGAPKLFPKSFSQYFQRKCFLATKCCNKNYFSTYVFTQVCPLVPEAELPYWSPRRISLCSCASPSRYVCTGNADAPIFALTSNRFELRSDYIVRHFYKRAACFRKSYTDQRGQ